MRQSCSLLALFFWGILFLLFTGIEANAIERSNVGFRTLGYWIPARKVRLDINVWYPSKGKARLVTYAPYSFSVSRNGKVRQGSYPLLLLSHPSPANRFSFHDTASWLASHGFIVAAPTHSHDCLDDMRDLFTWNQLNNRVLELRSTIDLLLGEKDLGEYIAEEAIGLIGFGAGGATALLLGGAMPNCISWADYCEKAGKNDTYCNSWSSEKINSICTHIPLKKSLADHRIRAFAAVCPGFGMLFSKSSFDNFSAPILLLACENDSLNKKKYHADALQNALRDKTRQFTIQDADLGSLMAECPDVLKHELPDLCRSVRPKERELVHKRLWETLFDFFSEEFSDVLEKNEKQIPPK